MLIHNPKGNYHFLKGIDPYSCGVIADPGYEIINITLKKPVPWREGFTHVDAYLKAQGQERTALCAMQLRSPAPFTMEGFIDFNRGYCQVLQDWGLYVDELNPLARTNVAPLVEPPEVPMLYGFSHLLPCNNVVEPTFIIAGAGELLEGTLDAEGIVRRGETDRDAIREKATYVVEVMAERLLGLGGAWEAVNQINIYTVHPISDLVEEIVLPKLIAGKGHGVHWYPSRPPIVDIEYEMDMRGVTRELHVDFS